MPDKPVGQHWNAGLLWTSHRSAADGSWWVAQEKFNHNERMLLISTCSLQHSIVLASADFGIATSDLTPVFERLSCALDQI